MNLNPQSNPQKAMSYTTSANFGSPRGSVKSLKSLIPLRCHRSVRAKCLAWPTYCRAVGPHVFMGFCWWSASRVWARSLTEKEAVWNYGLLTYQYPVVSSLFQRAIPQPSPMNEEWLTSNAEVFETSAPSWGPSFAMSSVKSVASWLAREMET